MAKQIKYIEKHQPTEMEERAEAIAKLVQMTADNHQALITLMEIIEELHETGILDMVKGLLRTREKVGKIAVEQINQPTMHRVIKNSTNAFKFLGSIEPNQLQHILNGFTHGLHKSADGLEKEHHLGIWDLMKKMRDPDINASMTTLLGFLQGMGQEFNKKSTH